ncbi:MAG TPA: ribulose-phosphate 3-epimerase [Gammaproteobacteria bacterium]|nr:ribulose-phosphate 3-epimerase [Gammaproteobacteria bacterium]
MSYSIAPSLLAANWAALGAEATAVLSAGADLLHLDVMDNHYVPNLTAGPIVCEALRKHGIQAPIDVHLMTKPVDRLITEFAKAGATSISFHPEASEHVDRSLDLIHKHHCQAGLALNPATTLACLEYVLDKIDFLLIMSVNPGFGGQSFIPATLDKIRKARMLIQQSGRKIHLGVDGGIKLENIRQVAEAGADTFVVGSGLFHKKDYKKIITELRAELNRVKP